MATFFVFLIRIYQAAGFIWKPRCRFLPSCSEYACQAIELHGPWYGLQLAARRISRCQPWGSHGYDPIP